MGKKSVPIIIVLLLVLVAIGIFAYQMLTGGNEVKPTEVTNTVEEDDNSKPVVSLEKNVPDGTVINEVEIVVTVTTVDDSGDIEITLPDGTSVTGDKAQYKVNENGEYEFIATNSKGESNSNSIQVTEITAVSSDNPYVPEGFSVVEGLDNIEEGYTIEDSFGNQFVWVPVKNGKLTREQSFSTEYEESNSTASALVNSVAKNYGFYMGRYEASEYKDEEGNICAATRFRQIPLTNYNYQDAYNASVNAATMFGYTDCYTTLVNSYAWDTTLNWIDQDVSNYSSSINYGNYSGTIVPTGTTESDVAKNIYDMAGNVREWSTEVFKDKTNKGDKSGNVISRVIRGGSAVIERTAKSHIGYPESKQDPYWGFRVIIYK